MTTPTRINILFFYTTKKAIYFVYTIMRLKIKFVARKIVERDQILLICKDLRREKKTNKHANARTKHMTSN